MKKSYFLLLILFFCIPFFKADRKVFAQNDIEQQVHYTQTEQMMFAFYSLLGSRPDFTEWVTESKRYKQTAAREKPAYLSEQIARLNAGYMAFSPDEDDIEISLPVIMKVSNHYNQSQQPDMTTDVSFVFQDIPEGYIPLQVNTYPVALILKNREEVTNRRFDAGTYKRIAMNSGLMDSPYDKEARVTAEVKFRAVSIDKKGPVMMPEEVEMWLMLGEITSMEIWKEQKDNRLPIYDFYGEGLVPETQQELLNLYQQKNPRY